MTDITKQAYAEVLTFITNSFYSQGKNIKVEINDEDKGTNYYDGDKITLSSALLDAFGNLGLPRFLVYYHELGHHLYSKYLFTLLETWEKIKTGPLAWDPAYHHLVNWIEDFYIENRIVKEHSYLMDVVNCIKKLPPEYDITKIQYAFNYYYVNQAPTPSLLYNDQIVFLNYIKELLQLRDSDKTRFGNGVLSTLTIKATNETKFALKIIEFFKWCVSKGILPEHKQPPLKNPNQHLEPSKQKDVDKVTEKFMKAVSKLLDDNKFLRQPGGTYDDHSRKVANVKIDTYVPILHVDSKTELLKEELVYENKMIDKQIEMIQVNTQGSTISGLFNGRYSDSSIIQPRPQIVNFFNPHRLIDQNLFLKKDHTYMNVNIFRDISGSTRGDVHELMHYVTEHLLKEIPVEVDYYLYSSGEISIVKIDYIPWKDSNEAPEEYANNEVFQQFGGGTNSDAIADVMTQQLSDKWLNIIITDGDLNSLMHRENIFALLKNVFVVAVKDRLDPRLHGITINDIKDVKYINNVLASINLDG